MKAQLNLKSGVVRRRRARAFGGLGTGGSVAAEFALVAPIIVLLATGIADFGMLAT